MIASVAAFRGYFDGVRRRTVTFCLAVPPDAMDWAPKAGEYTCGDIVRHLAASETMFVGAAVHGGWQYPGHERALAVDHEAALARLQAGHRDALAVLDRATDADLMAERPTLEGGGTVKAWRLLLAMVEHEVHHRSQLASYLTLMGVEPPQIFGLGVEDVARLTADGGARPGRTS